MMADNRMFIIHRPTGIGIPVGRDAGYEWSAVSGTNEERFDAFYRAVDELLATPEYFGRQRNDFVLAMEDCRESSCFDGWRYTEQKLYGFKVFTIAEVDDESTE